MLKFIIPFLLLCVTSLMAQPVPMNENDQRAILRVMDEQQLSWNAGDIDRFMLGYWQSDSLVFIGSNGPVYGWTQTLGHYRKNYPDVETMGDLTFDIIELKSLGANYARMLGKFTLVRKGTELAGYFTLLWHRFPEGWRIISDHSSAE